MPDLIQNWDVTVLNWLRSNNDPLLVWSAWLIATLAWKGVSFWILAAILWLRNQKLLAVQIVIALLIAIVEIGSLKGIVSRPRPDLYVSQHLHIPMPELLTTAHSFPSGHVTLAAAGVYVLAATYGAGAAIAGWIFVVLVGVARVYQGLHWASDIAGSIVLGIVAGALAINLCRIRRLRSLLRITPADNTD